MSPELAPLVLTVFLPTYLLILTEKMHRTTLVLMGATLLVLLHAMSQESAIHHIDFNTLGLLVGMMIIVNITKRSGLFSYVAIVAARRAQGDPWKILVFFSLIAAVFSALLDNVTTMLLIVPVTLVITDTLEISPVPFMVPLILMANIGGTATLIGDPPNIMIGSATGLGFLDFLVNLAPAVIVILAVTLGLIRLFAWPTQAVDPIHRQKIMSFEAKRAIKDVRLLRKSLAVLALTLIGFLLHQKLGYESATVALFGAAALLVISGTEPEEILLEIEWPTLFFFGGLFILVGGLQDAGIIDAMATGLLRLTHGNPVATTLFILWGSALASAFLDNIPFVATMIPLVQSIAVQTGLDVGPMWWALALGACLGGNGTLVGASANLVTADLMGKHGEKLSFARYLKVGFPMMLVSIAIASIYLAVFYL